MSDQQQQTPLEEYEAIVSDLAKYRAMAARTQHQLEQAPAGALILRLTLIGALTVAMQCGEVTMERLRAFHIRRPKAYLLLAEDMALIEAKHGFEIMPPVLEQQQQINRAD